MRQRQRRSVAVLAALLVAALVMSLVSAFLGSTDPAGAAVTVAAPAAQDTGTDDPPSVTVPDIIPEPNQGRRPERDTDPGGWAQYAVFWGMLGAILVIVGLVVLESRRKLRRRAEAEAAEAAAQTRSSTRSEPVADTSANAPDSSARS